MRIFVFVCLLFFCLVCRAQNKVLDSLDRLIVNTASDTQRVNRMISKIEAWVNLNLDSAAAYASKTIQEAQRIKFKTGEAGARIYLANTYCFKGDYGTAQKNLDLAKGISLQTGDSAWLAKMYDAYGMMHSMQNKFDTAHLFYEKGIAVAALRNEKGRLGTLLQNDAIAYQQQSNYPQALDRYQKALDVSKQAGDEEGEAYVYLNIAITHLSMNDTARAEQNFLKATERAKKLELKNVLAYAYSNLSSLYERTNRFSEQYDFGMKAAELAKQMGDQGIEASSLSRAAMALAMQQKFEAAEKLSREAILVADASRQPYNAYQAYSGMGTILRMGSKYGEAVPYFEKAVRLLTGAELYTEEVGQSYFNLSECYEKTGDYKKALVNYKVSAEIADSIRKRDNVRKATELTMNREFEGKQQAAKVEQALKDAAAQKAKDKQRRIMAVLAIGAAAVVVIALLLFRNNRQRQKANRLLETQKQTVEVTLAELKSAQAQLIQSEKMASLGELTAGIAHEIQNPLNFVNNFSEVSGELIDELSEELDRGDVEEAKAIGADIKQNLQKIAHHGKRADGIVKGMLQHSRSGGGQKESTDINALLDEYLRLAYHGARARDKSFNASLKTGYDEATGRINIVPQDIGRVVLNLITNAFYAVDEKRKTAAGDYEPVVSVGTKRLVDKIELRVADNGTGIPQAVMDKIFQPFFTTKPTGQGTGLGLSLAYDIVKAHNGELKVEARASGGAEFIITLPG